MRAIRSTPFLATAAALITGALLIGIFFSGAGDGILPCTLSAVRSSDVQSDLKAVILHYATSQSVPQQSLPEILVSYNVLRRRSPCNLLVFGLGLDSPMWSALNAGGRTLFLEESQEWVEKVTSKSPVPIRAHTVKYHTRLDQAAELLKGYRSEPSCLPLDAKVKGNSRCRLALWDLPEEVYAREWDAVMIDAPRGYFAAAPGRMAAIWSAAVMARGRKGEGETDVFLHDVDRPVERDFAMEFLCKKYLVEGKGRIWHFKIPPTKGNDTAKVFC